MIMRVFQVTTHLGKDAEFGKFFHEKAIPPSNVSYRGLRFPNYDPKY